MSAIDYISHGNPANQKPPITAPSVPAFCLDVKDAELFEAIHGEWQIVGSAMAYLITTGAGAVNPSWDATTTGDVFNASVAIAVFKQA